MTTTDLPEPEIQHRPATCETCQGPFSAALYPHPFRAGQWFAEQKHCDACVASERERMAKAATIRRAEQAERDLQAAWERICPPDFRTTLEGGPTDMSRMQREMPQLAEIMSHPFGPSGLILRGDTGAGKTRAMFRLLRSYFVGITPRPRIYALTSGQFDRQARDAGGSFTLTEWFDRLAECDALFLDDVGKAPWTASTTGHFWELVDHRTRHNRPLFLTSNFSGPSLVKVLKMDEDTAGPLLRRLREHCRIIVCTKNT